MTAILVRPLDPAEELPYLHATARRLTANMYGGGLAHWPTICTLVDGLLNREGTAVTVALMRDEPDIMGWVARGADGAVEMVYLRHALQDQRTRAPTSIAVDVVRALLPERTVILRRMPLLWVMKAIRMAGYEPSVIPRGV